MPAQPPNPEVAIAAGPVVAVTRRDVDSLKSRAEGNCRRRMRLCAHQDSDDPLHEMLIILGHGSYIRPHKHLHKTESFHIMEGRADLVLFDDEGRITDVLRMGEYASGRTFYYRLCAAYYHTVMVRSDFLTFHETTNGPFQRADTIFPGWAPEEADAVERDRYLAGLAEAVEYFLSKPQTRSA